MEKQITVLVVDDEPKNLREAYEYITGQGHRVLLAASPKDAGDFVSYATVVITDLFMPWPIMVDNIDFREKDIKEDPDQAEYAFLRNSNPFDFFHNKVAYFIARNCLKNFQADQPVGLSVAAQAKLAGKPCVICTSIGHHGKNLDWVCYGGILEALNAGLVEGMGHVKVDGDKEFPKNWEQALEWALRLLKEKGVKK
jgi:CheY-like chemotaxis protein